MTWLFAIAAVVMALMMSVGYLGAFLNPETHLQAFPIGIVNQDAGVSVLGQQRNVGLEVTQEIVGQTGDSVEWKTYASRDELVAAIERDDVYAGLVIPADFTSNLAGIRYPQMAQGERHAASIEILRNHGGGSITYSTAQRILDGVTTGIEQKATAEVMSGISGDTVPTADIALYSQPVTFSVTEVVPARDHTGLGMAPIYSAIVISVGGFLASTIVNLGVDFMAGHGSMGPRLEKMRGAPTHASLMNMFATKVLALVVVAILGGIGTWAVGVAWLGMPVSNGLTFVLLAVLGMLAAGLPTLALVSAIGTPGVLVGLILSTILGVPSSGGVFPLAMLPEGYRAVGSVLPMRYLYEGIRSLIFFDGAGPAGLDGWWVLAVWAIGALLIGAAVTWTVERMRGSSGANDPASAAGL